MAADKVYRTSRMVFAPQEAIYAAMIDPDQLTLWLAPDEAVAKFEEFDLRPGGKYCLVMHYEDSATQSASGKGFDIIRGRFVDLVWDQHIVHAVELESAVAGLSGTMRLSWAVEDRPEGTCVIIEASCVPPGLAGNDLIRYFDATLDRLAFVVERQPGASIIFAEAEGRTC